MQGSELDDYFPSVLEVHNTGTLVIAGPCLLLGAWCAANGGDTGAYIRKGSTDKATAMGRMMALDGTTSPMSLQAPVYSPDGLFIDPDDANAYVTIQWSPLPVKLTE